MDGASSRQCHWHHGWMIVSAAIDPLPWLRGKIPNGSQSSTVRSTDDIRTVIVILVLRKKKHRFMRFGGAVADRLWMSVRFVPNHFRAKPPSGRLERKRQTPRYSDQIFWPSGLPALAFAPAWHGLGFFGPARGSHGSPTCTSLPTLSHTVPSCCKTRLIFSKVLTMLST